ncbi:MAG: hypothetical protein ABI855_07630 [Bacteroidota bacterium]
MALIKYRDKDTKQVIIYLPSLEISSYGETEIKANKMLNTCLVEYFDFLLKSSFEKIGKELSKLGWKHDKIRKKEFSKAFVDIDGNLKNFNAINNKVELSLLESNF